MRLIDADFLLEWLDNMDRLNAARQSVGQLPKGVTVDGVRYMLDHTHTLSPEILRPTGHWYRHNQKQHGDTCFYCSACEHMAMSDGWTWELTAYCPYCGARMEKCKGRG